MKLAVALLLIHSWYPQSCCGGNECEQVPCDSITETKDGYEWHGLTFNQYQVHPSLDQFCHACAGHTLDMQNRRYPHCLFIQANT